MKKTIPRQWHTHMLPHGREERYADKRVTRVTQSRIQKYPTSWKNSRYVYVRLFKTSPPIQSLPNKHNRSWPSSQQFLHKRFWISSHFSAVLTWKALPPSNHNITSDGFRVSTVRDNESTEVVTKLRYRSLGARGGKVHGVWKYTFLALAKNTFRTHTHSNMYRCFDK